jgi:uncharacterized protein
MEMIPLFGAGKPCNSNMSGKKPPSRIAARGSAKPAKRKAGSSDKQAEPPQISGRWLISGIIGAVTAAALCAWGALCLLFWQGSWQLLYHPSASVKRTPSTIGLAFNPVAFAVTDEGEPRLNGWWIPAAPPTSFSLTVLFLHGQTGNLEDTLSALNQLHTEGVNVLAFDYRGYGKSQFVRPSEDHWRQDADWALNYLTGTRHIPPSAIVLDGEDLGANLALEVAAAHPELAGVILQSPITSPMDVIFSDARAKLVPARILVHDRYDLSAAATKLQIPALWFEAIPARGHVGRDGEPAAYRKITGRKTLVWLNPEKNADADLIDAVKRWLDDLPQH